jgi:hypothetical protein
MRGEGAWRVEVGGAGEGVWIRVGYSWGSSHEVQVTSNCSSEVFSVHVTPRTYGTVMHERGDFQKPTAILRGTVIGVDKTNDHTEVTVRTQQGEDRRMLFR